jgi:uncharacterized membrane protein
MFKSRLEALSDGIFAIVFTLLVIEIKVPEQLGVRSGVELSHALAELAPLFFGFGVSFVVLAMYWMSHSFLYGMFTKATTREMMYLNLIFLALISLVPFSAHLIGRYLDIDLAVIIYGLHILLISVVSNIIFFYALGSKEIDTSHNSTRLIKQAKIRQLLTLGFMFAGVIAAYFSFTSFAFGLYMFPIFFNIIPGSLNFAERLFKISLD